MCYRPITIQNPYTGEYMKVPCGKCLDCLRKYQNQWSIRMFEEYKSRGCKGVFFTLTYDEAHVPKNYLVDYEIYRTAPDYGFGNVRMDGYGKPKAPHGARKKYAEPAEACLGRAGLFRDDCYECNQDIIKFNEKRSPSKHRDFLRHLEKLFAEYYALTSKPLPVSEPKSFERVESWLDIENVDFDMMDIASVDEETGEVFFKKDYESPCAIDIHYRERPIIAFNSVRKEDVQLWLKRNYTRFHRRYPKVKLSHFITSEYGPSTLRPHYHGVIFGATKDELREWFKDWQVHYGVIVDYDNLDITKGGLSYVAKYCSKGAFEHPLCSKDFFYFYRKARSYKDVICSEYHSKHYEKCIQWFGIDAPIVDPTFKLISKGLGKEWCENDVPRCKEFENLFVQSPEPLAPESLDFDGLLDGSSSLEEVIAQHEEYLTKKQHHDEEWKEFGYRQIKIDDWLQKFKDRCVYKRNFISADGEKIVSYSLPKYYREKMFGPGLRATYPNFVASVLDSEYKQKLRQMVPDNDPGKVAEACLALEAEERQRVIDSFNKAWAKQHQFYEKSKL